MTHPADIYDQYLVDLAQELVARHKVGLAYGNLRRAEQRLLAASTRLSATERQLEAVIDCLPQPVHQTLVLIAPLLPGPLAHSLSVDDPCPG